MTKIDSVGHARGRLLRRLRQVRNLRQKDVADTLGWSSSKVCRIEKGETVNADDLYRLINYYHLTKSEENRLLSHIRVSSGGRFDWRAFVGDMPFNDLDDAVRRALLEGRYLDAWPLVEAMAATAKDEQQHAQAALRRGHRLMSLGHTSPAIESLTFAQRTYEKTGDLNRLVKVLNNKASLELQQNCPSSALALAHEALRQIEDSDQGGETEIRESEALAHLSVSRAYFARAGRTPKHEQTSLQHIRKAIELIEAAEPDQGHLLSDWCLIHQLHFHLEINCEDQDAEQKLERLMSKYGPADDTPNELDDVIDQENYTRAAGFLALHKMSVDREQSAVYAGRARKVARKNGMFSTINWLRGLGLALVGASLVGTIGAPLEGESASPPQLIKAERGNA